MTIDHNIPIPPQYHCTGPHKRQSEFGELRETLRLMRVGDSFTLQAGIDRAYLAARWVGRRIVSQKQRQGGWRVWRVQ